MSNDLKFNIHCKCGGSLTFSVNSVDHSKQYLCPNCGANLGIEVSHFLVNIKDSLNHHIRSCETLHNVSSVHLRGKII